jgi:hypothetical protein
MKEPTRRSLSILALAFVFGVLAVVALVFASKSMPGDGVRHVLMFLTGMFTVAAFLALSRVVKILEGEG